MVELLQVEDLDRLNIIHVTGTKGKVRRVGGAVGAQGALLVSVALFAPALGLGGLTQLSPQGSACAFTECILRNYGLKTGFYRWAGGQEGFEGPVELCLTLPLALYPQLPSPRAGARADPHQWAAHQQGPLQQVLLAGLQPPGGDQGGASRGCGCAPSLGSPGPGVMCSPCSAWQDPAHASMPAYFRFLTIMAFHVFLQEKVSGDGFQRVTEMSGWWGHQGGGIWVRICVDQ